MLLIAIVYTVIATSLFIFKETKKDRPLTSWYLKALSSFGFILIAGAAIYERTEDSTGQIFLLVMRLDQLQIVLFIIFGLMMGLLGDLVLALRPLQDQKEDKKIIIYGISFFSIGHIFYLIALLRYSDFVLLSLIFGLAMVGIIYYMSKILKFDMGIAKIPALFYTGLIFTMVLQAIVAGNIDNFSNFSILFMTGAVLFAISDLILAPIYFKGDNRKFMIALNLSTYYAAQILIAASIYFIS
ncbi:MAG: lysoplasmalogenase [Bacillota bacterium]|nr:MAG: lysoplasmalogenase [Bacillota bacterium]